MLKWEPYFLKNCLGGLAACVQWCCVKMALLTSTLLKMRIKSHKIKIKKQHWLVSEYWVFDDGLKKVTRNPMEAVTELNKTYLLQHCRSVIRVNDGWLLLSWGEENPFDLPKINPGKSTTVFNCRRRNGNMGKPVSRKTWCGRKRFSRGLLIFTDGHILSLRCTLKVMHSDLFWDCSKEVLLVWRFTAQSGLKSLCGLGISTPAIVKSHQSVD